MSLRRKGNEGDGDRMSSLKRLRELRELGTTRLRDYEAPTEGKIYDEVTEEEFNVISKRRMHEDEFVVDDNGEGYADNGLEDWDNPQSGYSSEEIDAADAKGRKSKKQKKTGKKEPHGGGDILKMLSKHSASRPRPQKQPEPVPTATDAELMASIMQSLDEEAETVSKDTLTESKPHPLSSLSGLRPGASFSSLPKSNALPYRFSSSSATRSSTMSFNEMKNPEPKDSFALKKDYDDMSFDLPNDTDRDNDIMLDDPNEPIRGEEHLQNEKISALAVDNNQINEAPAETVNSISSAAPPAIEIKQIRKSISKKPGLASSFLPKFEKEQAKQATVVSAPQTSNCTNWTELRDQISISIAGSNGQASSQAAPSLNQVSGVSEILEEDGSLNMYYFDAFEKAGVVYVFGKVLHKPTGRYLSTCAVVNNTLRNVYLLPRLRETDATGHQTDKEVTIASVYEEFNELRRKYQIKEFGSRPVQRGYAFELPGVPTESDYLKVSYSFKEPALPADLSGRTFSRAFGTNTNALELFLLKRKLMGPCWINVQNAQLNTRNISWCKVELQVDDPKTVSVIPESKLPSKSAPPFTIMSIALRTVMNHEKRANEIVSISGMIYTSVSPDGGSIPNNAERFTAIRQLKGIPLPVGFNDMVESQQVKPKVQANEMALLNYFLAHIKRSDPDVLVGHNFIDFDLDVLLHRMKQNNIREWSALGRLRRNVWPKLQGGAGGTGDSSYAERQIMSGRLVCDTYRVSKDLIRAKSYSLTHLAATQLNINRPNIEYDKIPEYFWDAQALFGMLQHCEFDAYLCASLMFNLQALPLTKQLTNLAGNLWSRTMSGGRAERNEYLLLHEFHQRKFICPDKTYNNPLVTNQLNENEDGDEEGGHSKPTGKGRRKPAYAGGLVLEPKKGLYDKYVLLLDFNSLYPSIIQEYNICFTTVARTYGTEEEILPNVPDPAVPKGVLPKLLATLVDRRRQVKSLMKDPNISPVEYAQYDIRQKALKLTANSMYGCLGFSHSRFHAKPLASLVTAKGREILQSTVDLAQQNALDVIYGDTDSIMVYTHTNDLAEVKKIGTELKKAVNKRYNLLEIEMDGFFQRMLLLQKKKYAAILVEEKNGQLITTMETKGLDLVRRDWCGLSHDVSNYVLQQIFSGESREDAVDQIHSYLEKVGQEVREGIIPIDKFVITKSLTKNPEEYADKNAQPHVQVALRLKERGLTAKVGDTIPYVICAGESSTLSARAYHPDDVRKEGSELKVDFEWYLSNQIHPPVSRLCQPIEGTDNARLANCLGLDTKKYTNLVTAPTDEELYTLESTIPVEERFKDCVKWEPRCLHCGESNVFEPVVRLKGDRVTSALQCPNPECGRVLPLASLSTQLLVSVRKHVQSYMDQCVVCDDPACRTRTRNISVYGRRCLVPGCRGLVQFEMTDAQLHTQIQYYDYLFDTERALEILKDSPLIDMIRTAIVNSSAELKSLRQVVKDYVQINARQFVRLSDLFSFHQKIEPRSGSQSLTGLSRMVPV